MGSRAKNKGIKAIILAAGYATRLYPLTLNIPKPLLKLKKDKSVIDLIVEELVSECNAEEIVVVTNDKFYKNFLHWRSKVKRHAKKISVLNDRTTSNDDRLGAIGDIYFAVKTKKIQSDVIVVGGDNLFEFGFGSFLKFAREHASYSSLGLFDVKKKDVARRFGIVNLRKDKRVVDFTEKPSSPRSTLAATCLYYFPKESLYLLGEYASDKSTTMDASGNYIKWLLKKSRVYGYVFKSGQWYDIGHLSSYREVVAKFNSKA